jgi:hypothetical protein
MFQNCFKISELQESFTTCGSKYIKRNHIVQGFSPWERVITFFRQVVANNWIKENQLIIKVHE